PALIDALPDENPRVRMVVAHALWKLDPKQTAKAVPVLVEGLTNKDAFVRQKAAYILGEIGPKARKAVPALGKALKDEDLGVRLNAVRALGEMGSASRPTIPALLD